MYNFISIKKIFLIIFFLLNLGLLSSCGNKQDVTLEYKFKNNLANLSNHDFIIS